MRTETRIATIIAIAALFAFGCGKKAPTTTPEPVAAPEAASPTEATAAVTPPKASATDLKTDKGVDVERSSASSSSFAARLESLRSSLTFTAISPDCELWASSTMMA